MASKVLGCKSGAHHPAGENWTAAKKASDKKDLGQLQPGFSPPQNALSAVNGMLRRLMALGELNLYNYSGGMPALSGSPELNGRVNGTALGKAEKANGKTYKVAGLSRDLVQVGMLGDALCSAHGLPDSWKCLM